MVQGPNIFTCADLIGGRDLIFLHVGLKSRGQIFTQMGIKGPNIFTPVGPKESNIFPWGGLRSKWAKYIQMGSYKGVKYFYMDMLKGERAYIFCTSTGAKELKKLHGQV